MSILEFREQSLTMEIVQKCAEADAEPEIGDKQRSLIHFLNAHKANKHYDPPSGIQIPREIECDDCQLTIRSDELYSELNPVQKGEVGSLQRFLNARKLYQAASAYPILSHRITITHIDAQENSVIRIRSHSDYLESLYYPGWNDLTVRGLLLLRSKYFALEEFFEKFLRDSMKYAYLMRVVYLWVNEYYECTLSTRAKCVEAMKGLLTTLEGISSLSMIESKTKEKVKEVSVTWSAGVFSDFLLYFL